MTHKSKINLLFCNHN